MPKLKQVKTFKNFYVTVFEENMLKTYPVIDIIDDNLEYEDGILSVSDAKIYFDASTNGMHYFFNVDIPSKVESKNLKLLRRSTALNNIFKYDRGSKFDLMSMMPWIIIVLLVLFK